MSDPDVKALARRIFELEERIASLSRSRQLTSSSIPITVDGEEGPEVVDVPLTVGVSQGVQAGEKAGEALEAANDALQKAADAQTTSNGKNSRRRGQTEPTPPAAGWVQGDQWVVDNGDGVPVEVRVWDGTAFVPEQILASELLVLSGGLVRLADGAVTAQSIVADAIDGMVITGATVRTAASGQRIQMDIDGLKAFNSSDDETSRLTAVDGGLQIAGALTSYVGGNAERATLDAGSLYFDYADSPGADTLSVSPGGIRSEGSNSSLIIEKLGSSMDILLKAGVSPSSMAMLSVSSSQPGGLIELLADTVRFVGDTDWVNIPSGWLAPGFALSTTYTPQYRRHHGYIEFAGMLTNSAFSGGYATAFTMPPALTNPFSAAVFPCEINSSIATRSWRLLEGSSLMQAYSSATSGSWWPLNGIRYPIV